MNNKTVYLLLILFCTISFAYSQDYVEISEVQRLKMLEKPPKGVSMVLDTDTYNEIDDQFALVYALLSKESFNLEAVYAAPFSNNRAENPSKGMELSYEEILRILDKMDIKSEGLAFKGSSNYLSKDLKAESSAATKDLIQRAMQHTPEDPLYVMPIGAITNIANAILLKPEITKNIVVIWLGGHAHDWPDTKEFNMFQDKAAANVVLDSGVPFVQYPCVGVVSSFYTTVPEMEEYLKGHNDISEYLLEIFKDYKNDHFGWSKVLWDMTAITYLINSDWTPSYLVHAPRVSEFDTYSFDNNRHLIRMVYTINRDPILRDFFTKIQGFGK
ncbi:MAG: purine nucleosidase [Saprospiraceae bacterium]|jgi:purine nucleosidase|tara:strand:- start:234 stop:1220 length:987 start_codon:yes stop_codon:yes gene_type:complete